MFRSDKFLFFTFILLLNISAAFPQTIDLKYEQIGLKQGLSQSTVYAITQDRHGFMWFGTQDGLNRYDGYVMKIYKHSSSDTNSISDDRIISLLSDSNGDLWIGTLHGGLDRYNLSNDTFRHYKHKKDPGSISDDKINCIFQDSNGNIWIGTQDGVNKYDQKSDSFTRFYFSSKDDTAGQKFSINAIAEDQEKNIWIGSSKGLFRYNPAASQVKQYENMNTNPSYPMGNKITSIIVDKLGDLWIGTWGAPLKRYDKKRDIFILYKNTPKAVKDLFEDSKGNIWYGSIYTAGLTIIDRQPGKSNDNISFTSVGNIQNDIINVVYEDKSGIIWIGTIFHGVYVYDRKNNRFKNYLEDLQSPNIVMALLKDSQSTVWVGTYGKGLRCFESNGKSLTYLPNPGNKNSLSSERVMCLRESRDGKIWIGTIGGGLNCFDKSTGRFQVYKQNTPTDNTGLSNNDITSLYEDSKGRIWIGNYLGGVDVLDRTTNTFTHFYRSDEKPNAIMGTAVTSMLEDTDESVWIGTDGCLNRYMPGTNSFKRYQLLQKENSKMVTSVNSLYKDEQGNLWVGTYGSGLLKYNPRTDALSHFTEKDGLPDNVIYSILPDKSGNLWLSTNYGISRYNIKTSSFKNYDVNDGLQSNEFNQGSHYLSSDGEIFFGGINGFNSFYPGNIEFNNNIPPVYLTTIKIFNRTLSLPNPVPDGQTIEVPYSQNFFSFEFVALNFTSPEKNQYAYKLEGFDKEWHKVNAHQRYASYTNLDPGEYTLRIKGSNNDGLWNDKGTYVTIIITPPFWMTWWFRAIVLLILISIAKIIYDRRISKLQREKELQQEISSRLIEKQEEERRRIALEMHDSLGPDLIFIKNRATSTMHKDFDKETACESFNQISSAASGVLNTVREISHNLRPPELDQLGLSETLRSILITARDSSNLEINGEIDNIDQFIPGELQINLVRILQEALNNIFKHSYARSCEIKVIVNDSRIIMSVDDNGKGFEKDEVKKGTKAPSGLGLTGMNERARILGGIFELDSSPGSGTHIKIIIPINGSLVGEN